MNFCFITSSLLWLIDMEMKFNDFNEKKISFHIMQPAQQSNCLYIQLKRIYKRNIHWDVKIRKSHQRRNSNTNDMNNISKEDFTQDEKRVKFTLVLW